MNHVLFEEKNVRWVYKDREIQHFRQLWNEGVSLKGIAFAMRRTQLDITLLILDQAEAGKIQPRETGIFGEETA